MVKNKIKTYYKKEIDVIKKINYQEVEEAIGALLNAYRRESVIYIFGNGGSGATASHFVCDFNKGVSETLHTKFRFVSLNDNIPMILSVANDISYEEIFAFQMKGRLEPEDLIMAISGSGNSENVIRAVKYAKETGCKVIGVTGNDGGRLRELADYHMHAASDDIRIIEDLHMSFCHMISYVLKEILE